jgi:hypothetical protein
VQPHDFYTRWGNADAVRSFDAGLSAAFDARDATLAGTTVVSPVQGNDHQPGFVLPICEVDAATHRVTAIDLHPMTWSKQSRATTGFPVIATGAVAAAVLDRLGELSKPYDTVLTVRDEVGRITI